MATGYSATLPEKSMEACYREWFTDYQRYDTIRHPVFSYWSILVDTFASCLRRVPFTSHSNEHGGVKTAGRYMRRGSNDEAFTSSREDLYRADEDETSSQELYQLKRVRRTSSLNVLHEEEIDDTKSDARSLSSTEIPLEESAAIEEHVHSRKALELENEASIHPQQPVTNDSQLTSNANDDNDDNLRVGSDIEDSDEEEEEFVESDMPSKEVAFLNKVIDEDILRTLPSLCVFQVCCAGKSRDDKLT